MMDNNLFIQLFLVLLAVVCAYMGYKLRRVHLHLYGLEERLRRTVHDESREVFRQLEALEAMRSELGFVRALPPTRGWAASPDFLLLIARHCLDERPRVVVECSSGVSTLVLGRAVQRNGSGHVYSLEHDPVYAGRTRAELGRHGLKYRVSVIEAPILTQEFGGKRYPWYDIAGLPRDAIDMLVIDGPPSDLSPQARYPAGPLLFDRLSPGACVFFDDADRPDETATVRRWADERPEWRLSWINLEKGAVQLRNEAVPV